MRIKLDLTKVCIETAAKKAYNRALSQYFKADPAKQSVLEPEIETLATFLKIADFNGIRGKHEELRGGTDAVIELGVSDRAEIAVYCRGLAIIHCQG